VVVRSLPKGVTVVVVTVSLRGTTGTDVRPTEIHPASNVGAKITATNFRSTDAVLSVLELAML